MLARCPLWVKSRHVQRKRSCPLYPRKRTFAVQFGMSAKCQKRTSTLVFHFYDWFVFIHDHYAK